MPLHLSFFLSLSVSVISATLSSFYKKHGGLLLKSSTSSPCGFVKVTLLSKFIPIWKKGYLVWVKTCQQNNLLSLMK